MAQPILFKNQTIENIESGTYTNRVFIDCVFDDVSFDDVTFEDCLFENVTFLDCEHKRQYVGDEITFNNCSFYGLHFRGYSGDDGLNIVLNHCQIHDLTIREHIDEHGTAYGYIKLSIEATACDFENVLLADCYLTGWFRACSFDPYRAVVSTTAHIAGLDWDEPVKDYFGFTITAETRLNMNNPKHVALALLYTCSNDMKYTMLYHDILAFIGYTQMNTTFEWPIIYDRRLHYSAAFWKHLQSTMTMFLRPGDSVSLIVQRMLDHDFDKDPTWTDPTAKKGSRS